jgi:Ca-activated chloride channel family protein
MECRYGSHNHPLKSQMLVDDRLLVASLYEKGEAREAYNEAKSEGKSASLLEMDRPNVYTMSGTPN